MMLESNFAVFYTYIIVWWSRYIAGFSSRLGCKVLLGDLRGIARDPPKLLCQTSAFKIFEKNFIYKNVPLK